MTKKNLPDTINSDSQENDTTTQQGHLENKRPLGVSVLLIFSLVYSGLALLIMIAGLFFPDIVQNILQQYYKQFYISKTLSVLIITAATIVFGVSLFGLVLLWNYRKRGFYYFAISQIIILLSMVFVLKSYDWINIAVIFTILAIIGVYARSMK